MAGGKRAKSVEMGRMNSAGRRLLLLLSVGALVYFTRYDACLFTKYASLGAILLSTVRILRPDALKVGIPLPDLLLILTSVIWDHALRVLSAQQIPMLDQYLYRMDAALGQSAYLMGRLFDRVPVLAWISAFAYVAVPLVVAATYLTADRKREFCAALLVASGLGCLCFLLVPAAGPAFAFPGFPWHAPVIDHPRPVTVPLCPPNCMPSLHLAWALLILVYARWKTPAAVFLALTACATLGSGQHYLVDLLAAVPFSMAVVWIVRRDWSWAVGWAVPRRFRPKDQLAAQAVKSR
jgi:hypothetical protein